MNRVFFLLLVVLLGKLFPCSLYCQDFDVKEQFDFENDDLDGFDWSEEAEFESEVVASSLSETAGEQRILPQQIAQFFPKSTDELLMLSPGVSIAQHGAEGKGHQLFLRGFDAAHGSDVEVRMDGVALNEPSNIHGSGYLDLYGIIPEVVSEIKVLKGPFLPTQGNFATGGSVHFKLGVPDLYKFGMMRGEVDSRGRVRAVQVMASPKDSQRFVAVDAVFNSGFAKNREAARTTGVAKYSWNLGPSVRGRILANAQMAWFESPGTMAFKDVQEGKRSFYDSYGAAGNGDSKRILLLSHMEKKSEQTELNWKMYAIRRGFSLEENFTGFLLHEQEGDRKRQSHQSVTFASDVELTHRPKGDSSVLMHVGAGWRLDRLQQSEHQVNHEGAVWRTNIENTADLHELYTYGGVAWTPVSWVRLQPSMRLSGSMYDGTDKLRTVDRQETFGGVHPRVAVGFPLNGFAMLFASYGRGYRLPEARAIFVSHAGGNADMSQYSGGEAKISTGDFWEWGASFTVNRRWNLKAVGYLTYMANEVVFDHVSNTNLEKNRTRRLGGEFSVSGTPLSWCSVAGDVSLVNARFIKSGHHIPGVPVVLSTVRVSLGKERGPQGGMSATVVGKRTLAHNAVVGGYIDAKLQGGWRFKDVEVGMIIDNLFAQKIMAGAYHFSSRFDVSEPGSALPRIHYAAGNPITARLILTLFL